MYQHNITLKVRQDIPNAPQKKDLESKKEQLLCLKYYNYNLQYHYSLPTHHRHHQYHYYKSPVKTNKQETILLVLTKFVSFYKNSSRY